MIEGSPQEVKHSSLHVPRSLCDFLVCDILGIVGDNGLRRRCLQFMRALYDFLFWLSSIVRTKEILGSTHTLSGNRKEPMRCP